MAKHRTIALLICLLTGYIGGHLIYLREYAIAKKRILWFFFCNPVAFYNMSKDFRKLWIMNDYQFRSKYSERVKGTGVSKDLRTYVNKLESELKK
jgi:hypothetical protein